MARLSALAVALALLAFAGCADDPAPTTTADDGAARAAYIAKADGVCAGFQASHPEVTRSIRKFQQVQPDDPKLLPKAAAHFGLVLKVASDFSSEFTGLEPPAADRARIDELNRTNTEALAVLATIVDELEAGRSPDAMFRTYGETVAKASRLAQAYGFEVCSRNG